MPQQPESTSPLLQLQSCFLANTEATKCLDDESPMQCFWNVLQSRITGVDTSIASLEPSSAKTFSPTRADLVNAHGDMRQDWNISNLVWTRSNSTSFRG